MKEGPFIEGRIESGGSADERLILKVGVTGSQDGRLLLLVDLSDSCAITKDDLHRLSRFLQPVPRDWPIGLGMVSSTVLVGDPGRTMTVADVVDGVVDLPTVFLSPKSVRGGLHAGSFLGPSIDMHLFGKEANAGHDGRVVVVVLTDGMLSDLDAVTLPEGVAVLGIMPPNADEADARWREVLPHSHLLGASDPAGAGLLRILAGCSFYGPCTIVIPVGTYRLRAEHETPNGNLSGRSERSQLWDFSLGNAWFEFYRRENAVYPTHLVILGVHGDEVSLPVRYELAQTVNATLLACPPKDNLASSLSLVSTTRTEVKALAGALEQVIASKQTWQNPDGCLSIPIPSNARIPGVIDPEGQPMSDAIVLILSESVDGDDNVMLFIAGLQSTATWELDHSSDHNGNRVFTAEERMYLYYHKLDARWIFQVGEGKAEVLPPRGPSQLQANVTDGQGRPCRVFFSGTLLPLTRR